MLCATARMSGCALGAAGARLQGIVEERLGGRPEAARPREPVSSRK